MKPAVIVVHGLYLHALFTRRWQTHLRGAGYQVYGFNYRSISRTLSEAAHELSEFISAIPNEKIHCVGHSLGGLLIMQMLHEFPQGRVRRVVLVGSPYCNAHVPKLLAGHAIGRVLLGNAMAQWAAQKTFATPAVDIGVIAGSRPFGLGRLVAPGIPEPHDGTVAVDETTVPGMMGRIVLPVTHTQMLFSKQVMRQMENFLNAGKFEHAAEA
jgi:pimeloyl-ACP methyl ester carboxylesterase